MSDSSTLAKLRISVFGLILFGLTWGCSGESPSERAQQKIDRQTEELLQELETAADSTELQKAVEDSTSAR